MSEEEIAVMGKGLTNLYQFFGGFEIMAFAKNKSGCSLCARASGYKSRLGSDYGYQ